MKIIFSSWGQISIKMIKSQFFSAFFVFERVVVVVLKGEFDGENESG